MRWLTTKADGTSAVKDIVKVIGDILITGGSYDTTGTRSYIQAGNLPAQVKNPWEMLDDGSKADFITFVIRSKQALNMLGIGGLEVRYVYAAAPPNIGVTIGGQVFPLQGNGNGWTLPNGPP